MRCERGFQVFSSCVLYLAWFAGFAPAATITGIVVNESRAPISGAFVAAVHDERIFLLPDQLGPLASSLTNAEGRFTLSFAEDEDIVLLGSAPGYRLAKFPLPEGVATNRTFGIMLEPGVQIEGIVLDSSGKPASGAAIGPVVPSIDMERSVLMRSIPQWIETDANGSFKVDHLEDGVEYQFLVRLSGHELQNARARGGKQPITLKLRKGGSDLTGQLYTARAPVQPYDYRKVPVRLNGNGFDYLTIPDAEGAFRFDGLPDGAYSLEPLLPPDRASRVVTVSMPNDSGSSRGLELPPGYYASGTVLEAETSNPMSGVGLALFDVETTSGPGGEFRVGPLWRSGAVDLRLLGEKQFRLQETPDSVTPDANGYDDVTGIRVFVRRARTALVHINDMPTTESITVHLLGDQHSARKTNVTTTPVEITVFEAGEYHAFADAPGSQRSSALTTVSLVDSTSVSVALAMKECAGIEGTAVRLAAAITPDDQASTAPARPFTISLRAGESAISSVLVSSAVTDRESVYRMPCLPAGSYILEASNSAGTRSMSRYVQLSEGSKLREDFEFTAGNDLSGRVLDADSGTPIAGVEVKLLIKYADGRGMLHRVETDANGCFTALDMDVPKLEAVQIDRDGFMSLRETGVVLPRTDLILRLKPLPGVQVVVQASPQSQWRVNLVRAQELNANPMRNSSSPVLDFKPAQGETPVKFGLPGWGRYYFHAQCMGQPDAVSEPVAWSSFEPPPAQVVLVPGATGRMVCQVPESSAATEVTAVNMIIPDGAGAGTEFSAQVQNDRCSLDGLPPGDYLVFAGLLQPQMVAVLPNRTTNVSMKPLKLVQVSGRVLLRGSPVVGCQVELRTIEPPRERVATTGEDGSFLFPDISPGLHAISAHVLFREGDLSVEREINVPPEPERFTTELDLTPPDAVPVVFPPGLQVKPGTQITFMNEMTRQTSIVRWENEGAEVGIVPGTYEVWREDQVIGTANFVQGKVEVQPKE